MDDLDLVLIICSDMFQYSLKATYSALNPQPFALLTQCSTTRGVATPKNRCRIIIFLIVINMGSAKEGLADASAPPRKTKAPPLHPEEMK